MTLPSTLTPVNTDNFLLEVDHLLIYTTEGTSVASILQEFGLNQSKQVLRRTQQGTASTIFFFENIYLEIIWIEDEDKARQQAARTGLDILTRAHWKETGSSPFGIGLRHRWGGENLKKPIGNNGSDWRLDSNSCVNFSADNLTTLTEPICYTLPNSMSLTTWLDRSSEEHRQLITHPLGIKKLTEVEVTLNSPNLLTQAVSLLEVHNLVSIKRGVSPLLELTFDRRTQGQILDVRPILPLVLKY